MRRFVTAGVACLLGGMLNCTSQLTGGGTETTNGISGTVAIECCVQPAEGGSLIAAVYASSYRPDSGIGLAETTVVASSGAFRFDSLTDGRYNLFVWDTTRGLGAFCPGIPSDTTLGTIKLVAAGALVPEMPLGSNETRLEVMIPGTPFHALSIAGRPLTLVNIPEGTYLFEWRDLSRGTDAPITFTEKTVTVTYPENLDTLRVQIP